MKNYHVHVYKISGLQQFDINAENEIVAREKALNLAKQGDFQEADCKMIAQTLL